MSQFVVSARKYRPAAFDEVVGQNHVAQTLKNALQTDKLAHAFLFCGPRGVGKTTCARILAKVINCQNPVDKVTACNSCSSCKSFAENASFNIFELDAASNNSVEHIRHLIEQVRFQPQQGSYKIFIIDEVHMLSTQAFNAFLKTLEEPPSYAIFILATTEKHKILPTILSRCQIFDFKRIQPDDVVYQLEQICKAEHREADQEALHAIAQKADGAMRDALSIFDKISSATQGKITYQDVVANLNILDYDYFFKTIDDCLRGSLTDVLLRLDEVIKNGFDTEIFIQGLCGHIRDLLVSKDAKTIHLIEGSKELKMRYYHQSSLATSQFLLSSLNLLNECDITLSRATNKRLQVEIALAKMVQLPLLKEVNIFAVSSDEEKKNDNRQDDTLINEKPSREVPQDFSQNSEDLDKVDDTVSVQQNLTITPATDTVDHKEEIVVKDEPTKSEPVATSSDLQKADQLQEKPNVNKDTNPRLDAISGLKIPSIEMVHSLPKMADLKEKIKKVEAAQLEAQNLLTIENLQAEWDAYVDSHKSSSFQAAVKPVKISLDGKVIRVVAPSLVAQGNVAQEAALMDRLRDRFGTMDLQLDIIVDKDQFPDFQEEEQQRGYYTDSESYQVLVEKNPLILSLIQQLELKIDSGHR